MAFHRDRRRRFIRLRQADFLRRWRHCKRFIFNLVALQLAFRHPHRASFFQIVVKPGRIRPHQRVSHLILDREIPVAIDSLKPIRPGRNTDPLAKMRLSENLYLPSAQPPRPFFLIQIGNPEFQILRLERRTILKIIHDSHHRKISLFIRLTVPDPAVKCIHIALFSFPAPRTISAHPPSAVSSYTALTFCHETHYIRFEPRCLLTDPEYCRICRTHGAVSAIAAAQTKKIIKKAKKVVDESVSLQYNTNRSIHWAIAKW